MDFFADFYNAIIDFITRILEFFGLNTDRVPGEIEKPETDGE